jgi:hypothetical protein
MLERSRARSYLLWLMRLLLCVAIGEAISAAYWGLWIVQNNHTLIQGITGQVEDGLSTLQAILSLGGIVGGLVGILFASRPWRAENQQK